MDKRYVQEVLRRYLVDSTSRQKETDGQIQRDWQREGQTDTERDREGQRESETHTERGRE